MIRDSKCYCPITRALEICKVGSNIPETTTVLFEDDRFHLLLSERIAGGWHRLAPDSFESDYSPSDINSIERALALLRSLCWGASMGRQRNRIPFLVEQVDVEFFVEKMDSFADKYELMTFDQLYRKANSLTFRERSYQTLKSLFCEIQKYGAVNNFNYVLIGEKSEIIFRRPQHNQGETGITYATIDSECHLMYDALRAAGYIEWTSNRGCRITGAGYELLETHRTDNTDSLRSVFVIRAYDPTADEFLRAVFDELQLSLGVTINAVWEEEHIEKIDERILMKIRESSAVILNVAANRFNVGFEAGYALALQKPIVAIREIPIKEPHMETEDEEIPFDIATLNCFSYTFEEPDKLLKILEARLALAIGKRPKLT